MQYQFVNEVKEKMVNNFTKQVAPVIDIFPDFCGVKYRYLSIRNKMELLAELGYKRVYLVVSLQGMPMYSNPWLSMMKPNTQANNHALESLVNVGDPVFEHIYEAHRVNMEAFAVVKPYEGGGGFTVPHGRTATFEGRSLPCIGGERIGFETFLQDRNELRVKRKPIDRYEELVSQVITRIRLTFVLDRVEQRIDEQNDETFPQIDEHHVSADDFQIWISQDNGFYKPYEGELTVVEHTANENVYDANGYPIEGGKKRCKIIDLQSLYLDPDARYFAITMKNVENKGVMIPFSMIKAYGELGEVPLTVSPYVRTSAESEERTKQITESSGGYWFDATYPQRADQHPEAMERFARHGFEFEWYGAGFWGKGWMRSPLYGIARGKMTYLKGTHCEAYDEVRAYWLDQIQRLIAMGIDGIDLRLQNHSSMVSDYVNYGYNEPIVEAYMNKYGVNILEDEADPIKLMKIRGEFYLQFVESVATELKKANVTLQIHLRHSLERENIKLSSEFGEVGFWAMPKVLPDWERLIELADEVTIKDYNWGVYRPETASQIKDKAASLGKKLWVHCYIAQGGDLNTSFVDGVEQDDRVTGVLLYEVGHNPYQQNPWIGLIEVCSDGSAVFNDEIKQKIVSLFGTVTV